MTSDPSRDHSGSSHSLAPDSVTSVFSRFSLGKPSVAKPSDFDQYLAKFLPLERDTAWTLEELSLINEITIAIGKNVWEGLPEDIRLNVVRGNAHEKNRLQVTSESARKIYEWRLKHNAGELLKCGPLPGSEVFYQAWPTRVSKEMDSFGHPIVLDRVSKVDLKRLMALDEEKFMQFRFQSLEGLFFMKMQLAKTTGHRIGKHVYIIDLAGLDVLTHFSSSVQKRMRPVVNIAGEIYPETLWSLWLINAPASFRMMWSVIRTWLDPLVRAKIRMFGKTLWQDAIQRNGVPMTSIPLEIGGKAQTDGLEEFLVKAAALEMQSAD